MTPLVHVTLRALAVLRGDDLDVLPVAKAACGDSLDLSNYVGASPGGLYPPGIVPTCPTCAVAWDEALEGRKPT